MNKYYKDLLKKTLEEEFLQKNIPIRFGDFNFMFVLYMKMFGDIPQAISPWNDYMYLTDSLGDFPNNIGDDPFSKYSMKNTIKNFIEKYKDEIYVLRENSLTMPAIFFEKYILFFEMSDYKMVILGPESDNLIPDKFMSSIIEYSKEEKNIKYVIHQQGFSTTPMKVRKMTIDLEKNYNDDLPDDEIQELLKNNHSGLIILHGEPGTGKTSYIRHLIYTIDKEFLFLDNSVFDYITDSSFIDLLLSWKNSIIILEDCEAMLKDRIDGNNKLSALLNLTDGILGDSLNLKFLCTFNANIKKIDKALLRKGRMNLKYEFKKLSKDKTKALAESLGKDIPYGEELVLSDIYNYDVKTDINPQEGRKIGFSNN